MDKDIEIVTIKEQVGAFKEFLQEYEEFHSPIGHDPILYLRLMIEFNKIINERMEGAIEVFKEEGNGKES